MRGDSEPYSFASSGHSAQLRSESLQCVHFKPERGENRGSIGTMQEHIPKARRNYPAAIDHLRVEHTKSTDPPGTVQVKRQHANRTGETRTYHLVHDILHMCPNDSVGLRVELVGNVFTREGDMDANNSRNLRFELLSVEGQPLGTRERG